MIGFVAHNDLWPWPKSSRSFSLDFAIKLLKYGTSCCVCSTAWAVLDELFPYLAQMITSIRGCVTCHDLWLWRISSWLFSCSITFLMDYIHMWRKYNLQGTNVPHTISRSIVQNQGHKGHSNFCGQDGRHPSWSMIYNFYLHLIWKYSFGIAIIFPLMLKNQWFGISTSEVTVCSVHFGSFFLDEAW